MLDLLLIAVSIFTDTETQNNSYYCERAISAEATIDVLVDNWCTDA